MLGQVDLKERLAFVIKQRQLEEQRRASNSMGVGWLHLTRVVPILGILVLMVLTLRSE